MSTTLVMVLLLASHVVGYEYGVPNTACSDMTPQHGIAQPQGSKAPYTIIIQTAGMCYTPGVPLMVTVNSPFAYTFRGLFVQARQLNDPTMSYGTFDTNGDFSLQTMSCFGGINNAICHNNIALTDFGSKSFKWTPPINFANNLQLVVTMVQLFGTYWIGLTQPLPVCASSGCQPSWYTGIGVHSVYGSRVGTYPNVAQCQNFCVAMVNCLAVDVHYLASTGQQECWLHTNSNSLVQKYADQTMTQYLLTLRCPCPIGSINWIMYASQNSFYGTIQMPYGQTLEQCMQACINNPQCRGLDFDRSQIQNCFFHLNDVYSYTRGPNPYVDQYVKKTCS